MLVGYQRKQFLIHRLIDQLLNLYPRAGTDLFVHQAFKADQDSFWLLHLTMQESTEFSGCSLAIRSCWLRPITTGWQIALGRSIRWLRSPAACSAFQADDTGSIPVTGSDHNRRPEVSSSASNSTKLLLCSGISTPLKLAGSSGKSWGLGKAVSITRFQAEAGTGSSKLRLSL